MCGKILKELEPELELEHKRRIYIDKILTASLTIAVIAVPLFGIIKKIWC